MGVKDESVGYGKPPKSTQFKKGASGNPKGRPKGAKNFATELSEELTEKISVKENGKKKNISKQRAMIKAMLTRALQGHPQAANVLFSLISKMATAVDDGSEQEILTDTDLKVLEKFKSAVLKEAKAPNGAKKGK